MLFLRSLVLQLVGEYCDVEDCQRDACEDESVTLTLFFIIYILISRYFPRFYSCDFLHALSYTRKFSCFVRLVSGLHIRFSFARDTLCRK
jgi:hypothetical protein